MNSVTLGIELTTFNHCSVALYGRVSGKVYEKQLIHESTSISKPLLTLCKKIVEENHEAASYIDTVSVCNGPGMFTGLRLAASIGSAYSLSYDCKIVGASSLEVMFYGHAPHTPVGVFLDARKNEYYVAVYEYSDTGIHTLLSPQIASLSTVIEISGRYKNMMIGNAGPDIFSQLKSQTKKYYAPYAIDLAKYVFEQRLAEGVGVDQAIRLNYVREGL